MKRFGLDMDLNQAYLSTTLECLWHKAQINPRDARKSNAEGLTVLVDERVAFSGTEYLQFKWIMFKPSFLEHPKNTQKSVVLNLSAPVSVGHAGKQQWWVKPSSLSNEDLATVVFELCLMLPCLLYNSLAFRFVWLYDWWPALSFRIHE